MTKRDNPNSMACARLLLSDGQGAQQRCPPICVKVELRRPLFVSFPLILVGVSFGRLAYGADEADCVLNRIDDAGLPAEWSLSRGAPAIAIDAESADRWVVIESHVWFGGLVFEWSEGPIALVAGECASVPFSLPEEAFLHPLADTYATNVLVRVIPVDEDGTEHQETALEVAYALWPLGADAPPVLMDEAGLATVAPAGVVDSDGSIARNAPADGVVRRYLPPISHELDLPRSGGPDEPTDHFDAGRGTVADAEVER